MYHGNTGANGLKPLSGCSLPISYFGFRLRAISSHGMQVVHDLKTKQEPLNWQQSAAVAGVTPVLLVELNNSIWANNPLCFWSEFMDIYPIFETLSPFERLPLCNSHFKIRNRMTKVSEML